jgi:dipeptidase E
VAPPPKRLDSSRRHGARGDAMSTPRPRRIVALGGGGFSMEPENPALDRFVVGLTGKPRPKVCFVPTASGDSEGYVLRFQQAFAGMAETSSLSLFRRTTEDLRVFVLEKDVVYVGGGNTANMLAVWRLHGLDVVLREAWDAGVILCGVSAGALCWFECGVTDSFGPRLAPLDGALGFISGSFCPHYDGEAERRPTYRGLVAGGLAPGFAADDGAAFVFEGSGLTEVVTSRREARAFRVTRHEGAVVETPLETRYLGERP